MLMPPNKKPRMPIIFMIINTMKNNLADLLRVENALFLIILGAFLDLKMADPAKIKARRPGKR
jgi:hypothetical protein